MIQATGIHKSYGSLEVLKGIDLHIAKRESIINIFKFRKFLTCQF